MCFAFLQFFFNFGANTYVPSASYVCVVNADARSTAPPTYVLGGRCAPRKLLTSSLSCKQCYPAEVFPTRFRASAHGMSAACGKAGAIISALAFNSLSDKIGTPSVLWSAYLLPLPCLYTGSALTLGIATVFFGCCIAGAGFSLLLPEVKGRDPDVIYEEEMRERARMQH